VAGKNSPWGDLVTLDVIRKRLERLEEALKRLESKKKSHIQGFP